MLNPDTLEQVSEGEQGELIITNLGRIGFPVIRYRTGDLVRLNHEPCKCGRTFPRFEGGVLGRVDDMVVVRGINVFPSAIENLVRRSDEVEEFRITISTVKQMGHLSIELDLKKDTNPENAKNDVYHQIRNELGLSSEIKVVPHGSLPRFEMKARRLHVNN